MNNTLAKLGSFKVSHVTGEKNGTEYGFYSLQRSYKDKNDEWKNESIIIRPNDMMAVAELLKESFSQIVKEQTELSKNREAEGGPISDDVPF